MRALSILIKRQIVDGVGYFAIAIFASIVLIVAITSVVLTEELGYLSVYAITLLITIPILVCIGSYVLGFNQAYNGRTSGITALLSVLPLTRGHILLAQIVTAALVILTALAPLAIIVAILWEFLGPPEWLIRSYVNDVFIGMSLIAFACYCIGLYTGQRAELFRSGLRTLLLAPILLLLIIVKGFGWPLIAVLLPFVVVLLLRCWSSSTSRSMTIISTGFMVLVLLTISLFWGRYLCDGLLVEKMRGRVKIIPSGLLPMKIENDPNVIDHSYASAGVSRRPEYNSIVGHLFRPSGVLYDLLEPFEASHHHLERLGIIEYFQSIGRGKRYTCYGHPLHLVHLDEVEGQLVYRRTDVNSWNGRFAWKWKKVKKLYVGPKGVSETANSALGRFGSLVIYFRPRFLYFNPATLCLVYDGKSRCFFAIDFENQTVQKGPELQDSAIRPIDIGASAELNACRVDFDLPTKEYGSPIGKLTSSGYLPIVDESGRIDLLDPNTLELLGPAGYLPRPKSLCGWGSQKPKDILAYDVKLISIGPYQTKGEYLGMVVGSLSRQGTSMTLAVFDKEGNRVKTTHTKTTFFEVPWGPELAMTKYLFESLHPPVLTLASFFTAYSFEAGSTHRALFFMPNSFVALLRDREGSIFFTFLIALLIMLPAMLLSGFLSWLVVRDAIAVGFSSNSRRIWMLGTLAFGLTAYITYRLTRPKITLVTCQNCGKPRRPDMAKCHRCGSKWNIPELTPPAWRVLGGEELIQDSSPAEETAVE